MRSGEFGKRSSTLLSPSRLRYPISDVADTREVAIPTAAGAKSRATMTQNRNPRRAVIPEARMRKAELRTSLSGLDPVRPRSLITV